MGRSLHILIVGASPKETGSLLSALRRGGDAVAPKRVETARTFRAAIARGPWDLVFAYDRPARFGGMEALAVLNERGSDLPVIILAGATGEERAASAMKAGASDHIGKGHWKRLLPVVERVLRESEARRERRQAEDRLRQSEERFRQLTENITEIFWMTDPALTKMLYISPGYEKIWGRSCASLYERPTAWLDAIHPDDRGRVEKAARAFPVSGRYDEEYRIIRPDGSTRWISDRAFPVKDASGRLYRITGIAEDITDRKSAEKALKDAKDFSENLIQMASVIVLGLDTEGRINIFNKAAEKITGYTLSELSGRSWFETLVPKARYPYVWEAFTRLIDGAGPELFENPILTKGGKERYILWRNSPIRVDGKIVGTISFGNDITDLCLTTVQNNRWERIELTRREKEVLLWVIAGKSNSEISAILSLSEHGVDFHLRKIFKKLGVTSRVVAALRGVQMGLISPD